jgi:hypothetical protein
MKLNKGFTAYTVLSGASALAMLIVLGAALFSPIETMFLWSDSALGTINVVMFALILASFLCYMLLPRSTMVIKLFSDILAALSLAAVAITLACTSAGNQESWFLSFSWYLRNFGYAAGFTIGFLFSGILGSFQLLSASYGRKHTEEKGMRDNLLVICACAASIAVFGIAFLALWRYSSAFGLAAGLFATALALAAGGVSLFLAAGEKGAEALLNNSARSRFSAYAKKPAEEILLPYKKRNSMADAGFLRRFYCRLFGFAGYSPSKSDIAVFWTALAGLALLAGCGIYGLLDRTEIDLGPGAPLPGTIRGFQLATLGAEILIVGILICFARNEIYSVQKDILAEKRIVRRGAGYPYFHLLKSVFEMSGLLMSVYFFCLVMYLPEVFMKELFFVALGASLYAGVLGVVKYYCKNAPVDLIAKLFYWGAYGLFMTAVFFLYRDSVAHGATNETGAFVDVWFPFEFIHSFGHYSLMGLCVGILLANSLFYKFFRAESFAPRNARAVGLGFAAYLISHLSVGIGYLLIFPEGYDSWPPTTNMEMFDMRIVDFMTIVFLSMAGLAVVMDIFKDFHIFSFRKHPDTLFVSAGKAVLAPPQGTEMLSRSRAPRQRKKLHIQGAAAWALLLSLGASLISIPAVVLTAENAYARTVVAEGDGYFIWTTDSYERISPEMKVVKKYQKNYVPTIRVGRNEYGSQQIAFTCTEQLHNLTASVSIRNDSYERITDCEIRYIDYIYDDTFAEILRPVNKQSMEAGQTGGFWFNFFTDYDQTPGIYTATLRFTFETKSNLLGKIKTQKEAVAFDINIEVGNYVVPQNTHYFFTLPAPSEQKYIDYYAKRHMNAGDYSITGFLMNDRWYIDGAWDWSGELTKNEKARFKKNYGIEAETGTELWEGWAQYQVKQIQEQGLSFFRFDDLNLISSALKNSLYWSEDGKEFNAELYRKYYGKQVYQWIYHITEFLSRYPVNSTETLLDRAYIKWKDEWDQSQFFPKNPVTGKLMEREDIYKFYMLEIEIYNKARYDAIADYNIQTQHPGGFRMLANVDPSGPYAEIFLDAFDAYCPLSYKTTDKVLEVCEANGKEAWVYTCVQPFLPYPNQFGYNQLFETHVTQWQIYEGNLRGYWLWRSDLKENALYFYGFNGFLDGQFIYFPDEDRSSFYGGIRLETSCESIEEAEFFISLDQLYNDLKARGLMSAEEADACLAELRTKVASVASQGKDFTKKYQTMRDIMDWTRDRLEYLATTYYANDSDTMETVVESIWE